MTALVAAAGVQVFNVGEAMRSVIARLHAAARDANVRQGMAAMPSHLLDDAGITDPRVRAEAWRRSLVIGPRW